MSSSNVVDASMLPDLLAQIDTDHDIDSVTADGAFDTHKSFGAISDRSTAAVVPPRRNAEPWKQTTAGAEVILPANTFFATAAAAIRCGATPVFCDIEVDSLLLSLEDAGTHCSPSLWSCL
ncbi:DegT/DnrJ/EryC1/StrS family aminotransferase [Pacificibacter marinus]|nr:DegT/DnrJ/EryC1/StrS family aminotransferase [Pacificibacter marinus]